MPSFGQLLLELDQGSSLDITQTQMRVNISIGDRVVVQCAEGYELASGNSNTPLGGSRSSTVCMETQMWSVDTVDLSCVRQSGKLRII